MNQTTLMISTNKDNHLALSKASVSVSYGKNSCDRSTLSSDLVICDNNFNTIVYAIEEGKSIN